MRFKKSINMQNQENIQVKNGYSNSTKELLRYSSFKFEIIKNGKDNIIQGKNIWRKLTNYKENNLISRHSHQKIGSQTLNDNDDKSFSEDKTMICHFFPCMKKFKSRENLDLHILNIHLKIKPFQCKYCERKFSHRNGIMILSRKEKFTMKGQNI